MKYITLMGDVFKLSDRSYWNYLQWVSSGGDPGRFDYKQMTRLGRAVNLTDVTPYEAGVLLEEEATRLGHNGPLNGRESHGKA